MDKSKKRILSRKKRAIRIRRHIIGTSERPRLCVKRSLTNIIAQIIDDSKGNTLVYISSIQKAVSEKKSGTKTNVAKTVGELIAEQALQKGIKQVVFDRKGYPYHGRIKALADAARTKGLEF